MKWSDLLCEKRVRDIYGGEKSSKIDNDPRTPFERDYDRTVFSTPFKRLQDKAQVFPLEEHDAVRTRLTHSLEVSSVARGLAAAAAETAKNDLDVAQRLHLRTIAATCALVHDLGNPPFGHAGERAIVEWFEGQQMTVNPQAASFAVFGKDTQLASDFLRFDGNAQTQRLISRLQVLSDDFGLNLTAATISASCKYTGPSNEVIPDGPNASRKKHGYFASENDLMSRIRENVGAGFSRHPIAVLVEAADDIVNAAADLEDGVRKKCFDWNFLEQQLGDSIEKHQYLASLVEKIKARFTADQTGGSTYSEACVAEFRIGAIAEMVIAVKKAFEESYSAIMDGTFDKSLIKISSAAELNKACKDIAKKHMFTNPVVIRRELMGRRVIHDLMDFYWPAICKTTDGDGLDHFLKKTYEQISPNYRSVFERRIKGSSLGTALPAEYYRMQLLTDQIAGMTDSFAVQLHRQLFNA